jgi:chromosome partitioning protein
LARAGKQVLLIDADTQSQAARTLGAPYATGELHRPGLGELVSGEAALEQVLISCRDGLWLLAGGRSLTGLKMLIARKEFGAEQTLAEALARLDDRFDYVILDTSPGWDALTVSVLFYASEVLTPVSLEVLTLQSLRDFTRSLAAIQKYHPLAHRYVLPTFYDRRVRKSGEILEQLRNHFPDQICLPIRYNVRLSEAPGFGQTIYEYAPGSPGAEDYQQLTERILLDGQSRLSA